ncbi:MAG: hypothetical protein RIC56_14205 [Pseudomonadales bacterium]
MRRPDTLVLQSHRQPLPAAWLEPCLDSVRRWARANGFDYRFDDDVLFESVPVDLRERLRQRPAIAADLARLTALQAALDQGYTTVVWLDADTLIFDPAALRLPEDSYALGREVWVQSVHGRLRAYVKVHNAFLLFRVGNPFLEFYRHAAERIVRAHDGPMAPQLVGPKLLTAVHNLICCPVAERAGMLSPLVASDLLAGGGAAFELFRAKSVVPPAALNLCASLVGRDFPVDRVDAVIERLLARGATGR